MINILVWKSFNEAKLSKQQRMCIIAPRYKSLLELENINKFAL